MSFSPSSDTRTADTAASPVPPPAWRSRRLLLPLTFLAFVSIGVPDGVLGVAWPSVRETFSLPVSQLGALLVSGTLGYLVSSFHSGQIISRIGIGRLLLWSSILIVVSSTTYALAPAWWVMVLVALLGGLGAGAIDGGLNVFAARHFSPRVVNWMHACFGVGATLGPMLMTGVLLAGRSWRWGYGAVAAIIAAMAVCFLLTLKLWEDDENDRRQNDASSRADGAGDPPPAAAAVTAGQALRRPLVWAHIGLFFFYTGIEATGGQWAYSLFTQGRGMPTDVAGFAVGLYWASLTVGRVAMGALAARVSADAILRGAMLATPVAGAIMWLDLSVASNVLGLAFLGFAAAPIFPLLISRTPARLGSAYATHAIGFQVSAACLGIAGIPSLTGLLARRAGLEVVSPMIVLAGVILLVLHEAVLRVTRDREAPRDARAQFLDQRL